MCVVWRRSFNVEPVEPVVVPVEPVVVPVEPVKALVKLSTGLQLVYNWFNWFTTGLQLVQLVYNWFNWYEHSEAGGRRQEAGGRRQEAGGVRCEGLVLLASLRGATIPIRLNLLASRYHEGSSTPLCLEV